MIDEISYRQVLPDRIRLVVTHHYLDPISDEYNYCADRSKYFLQNKSKYIIKRYPNDKTLHKMITDESITRNNPYIKNIRYRLWNPYSITMEYNFIERLLNYLMDFPDFDIKYYQSVMINEGNYINNKMWSKWNSHIVKNFYESITDEVMNLANTIWGYEFPEVMLKAKTVSIYNIEFNIDYFVGNHMSYDVMKQIEEFVLSPEGKKWLYETGALTGRIYGESPKKEITVDSEGLMESRTLKFFLSDNIFAKIYRKDRDDIRFEITFLGDFIKNKFNTRSYDEVYQRLRDKAKLFFKQSNFELIIKKSVDGSYSSKIPVVTKMYDILSVIDDNLPNFLEDVVNNTPISDPKLMTWIKRNKSLQGCYRRIERNDKVFFLMDIKKMYGKKQVDLLNEKLMNGSIDFETYNNEYKKVVDKFGIILFMKDLCSKIQDRIRQYDKRIFDHSITKDEYVKKVSHLYYLLKKLFSMDPKKMTDGKIRYRRSRHPEFIVNVYIDYLDEMINNLSKKY
ncbi:MAG: hypothetical protein R6U21_06880 [Thermoplasmatota archaeon]